MPAARKENQIHMPNLTIHVTRCADGVGISANVGVNTTNASATNLTDSNGYIVVPVNVGDVLLVYSAAFTGLQGVSPVITSADISSGTKTICLAAQSGSTGSTGSTCCFVDSTMIMMADGSEQPIDQVRVNDLVLGAEGRVNRVIHVFRPILGERQLYALNDGTAFVTAEHPFLTEDGWKSIDPQATRAENHNLEVGRLAIGDRLVLCKGCLIPTGSSCHSGECLELDTDSIELRAIRGHQASASTPLFNLLLDGDHTYVADGYLVHNKCFIVSAATGSSESAEVIRLRALRDRIATASGISAQLIDAIYREYYQFSPAIAAKLEQDKVARQAVLWVVVRPLLAWYTLAGTLAFEHADQDAVRHAVQEVSGACPRYLGASSIAGVLEAIRSGKELPVGAPQLLVDFAPRVRDAARLRLASWAILEPLVRVWRSAADRLDVVDEVSQWLAAAPLEVVSPPTTPGQLDLEVGALAGFFRFKPAARHQLGERLAGAWPNASIALENHGFIQQRG